MPRSSTPPDIRPWYKQLWPWLLISGPLLAMIGCLITIWLAFKIPDTPIRDGVTRQGFKVTEQVRP